MSRRILTLGVLGSALLLAPAVTYGDDCVLACSDGNTLGDGWKTSSASCCANPSCQQNCFVTGSSRAPDSHLSPGALLTEADGKLIAVAVLPGSPAAVAGLSPGDEIMEVNGRVPGSGCGASTWEAPGSPGVTSVRFRRGGDGRELNLRLATWQELISRASLASPEAKATLPTAAAAILDRIKGSLQRPRARETYEATARVGCRQCDCLFAACVAPPCLLPQLWQWPKPASSI
jgi:hypothetical protein